jgi:two-component system, NtrC family, nitrogen regulation sensor histidine kinase NtrY
MTKTKREIILFWVLLAALIFFSAIEWFIIRTVSQLDSATSVLFFIVLNINVIIATVFIFLSLRHLLRFFFSRHGKFLGKSLRVKLSIIFPALSIAPTLLIFLVSFFYIHASLDQWFKVQVVESVGDAVDLTVYYYDTSKNMLNREAAILRQSDDVVSEAPSCELLAQKLTHAEWLLVVDEKGVVTCSWNDPKISIKSLENLASAFKEAHGTVIRVDDQEYIYSNSEHPLGSQVYLGTVVPQEYSDKMAKVAFLAQEVRELNPYANPLKSIYTIALLAMTALIVFSSLWIGIHLADRLTKPLSALTETMSQVKAGVFKKISLDEGEQPEIKVLKESYNQMIANWDETKQQLEAALKDVKQINYDIDIQNKFVEMVLNDLDSAIVLLDADQKVVLHNRAFSSRFSEQKRVALLKELPVGFQRMMSEFQKKSKGKKQSVSMRELKEFSFRDGTRTYEILMRTLVFREGKDVLYLVMLHDFTDVQAEQTLKAWQEVVKRVAHEIKNPLTPVQLMNERMVRKLKKGETLKPEDLKETLDNTLHHVQVIKKLVGEFSKAASMPTVSPTLGTITTLVDRLQDVFGPLCHQKQIEFQTKVVEEIPPFPFDFNALTQVFQNLIQNALQALEGQGVKMPQITFEAKFNKKLKLVVLTLKDNGPGIDPSDQSRIFVPHFSTKEKGMGLGLSISKKLIEDHGGRIQVFSGTNHLGTRFVIELPMYRFVEKPYITRVET